MVPDSITFLSDLPTTSTDKVDYQGLKRAWPVGRRRPVTCTTCRPVRSPDGLRPDVHQSPATTLRRRAAPVRPPRHPELEVPASITRCCRRSAGWARRGATRSSAALGRLGAAWPPRRREHTAALTRARAALAADWDPEALRPALAANAVRFLARDYPLDGADDADGPRPVRRRRARGPPGGLDRRPGGDPGGEPPGGPHRGAALALPPRASRSGCWSSGRGTSRRELDRRFDRDDGPHPQSGFFLRRELAPGRGGRADPPRARGPPRRAGRLPDGRHPLGRPEHPPRPAARPDAARSCRSGPTWPSLTRAPVFLVFCTHRPGGRYALTIEPAMDRRRAATSPRPSSRYLDRLEARDRRPPGRRRRPPAWPCYGPPGPTRRPRRPGPAAASPPFRNCHDHANRLLPGKICHCC